MANARSSTSDVGAWSRSAWTAQFEASRAGGAAGKVKPDYSPSFHVPRARGKSTR